MGPLNAIVAKKLKKYQLIQMKKKDQVSHFFTLSISIESGFFGKFLSKNYSKI
jgi:hypothetical protein